MVRQDFPKSETHPLQPFLPPNARLLMLGSFPPQKKRWCMDFYYPNFINDMWRIMGIVFHSDKNYFVDISGKRFRKQAIEQFLQQYGIALYDTITVARRLRDNASDKYLETVVPTDLGLLLKRIPLCTTVVTTGQKATDTLCERFGYAPPSVGGYSTFCIEGRAFRHYRMPSSSRAYPMNIEKKAEFYKNMLVETGIIPLTPSTRKT